MSAPGGPISPAFTEADLHGFVDGRLEPSRQVEITRRLKTHPVERAHAEAWREQNDLIRATFSEVESEPIPVSLCLIPPTRLRCISSDGQALDNTAALQASLTNDAKRSSRRRLMLAAVTLCASLGGLWITLPHPAALTSGDGLASTNVEAALATHTADALTHAPLVGGSNGLRTARDLPTITIPSLAGTGFVFTGAGSLQAEFATLLLFYEDRNANRIVIGVTNALPSARAMTSVTAGNGRALTWQRSGQTYALSGNINQRRLYEIASVLQSEATTEGRRASRD